MDDKIATEFINEAKIRFDGSFSRLFHCLGQLDDAQIHRRPNENVNSVGVLVKHICGSFRQWTITQIFNAEDERNRPGEFLNDDFTKTDIIFLAENLRSDFARAIGKLDASRLTEARRVQGWDLTLMTAIFRALTHLEGHVGQIVVLTRIELGNDYKIFWTPQTDEQRSERRTAF